MDKKTYLVAVFAIAALALDYVAVYAAVTPAVGSFAYDAFDIVVNDILGGALGTVMGVAAVAFSCYATIKNELFVAIPALVGGGMLLKADDVAYSLGAII